MKATRLFLLIVCLIATLPFNAPFAVAQRSTQNTTFTSLISDVEINLGSSGEAVFLEDQHDIYVVNGFRLEEIMVQYQKSRVLIVIADQGYTATAWDQETIEGQSPWVYEYAVLGEGSEPGKSWQLCRCNYYLGYNELTYSEFKEEAFDGFGFAAMVFGNEAVLVDSIAWVQQNVTIDGIPALGEQDLSEIQSMVNGAGQPRVIQGHGTTAADWKDEGLVSESEWSSPTHGTAIEWDSNLWQLRYYKRDAIEIDISDGMDHIELVTLDNRGLVYVDIFEDPERWTPAQWVERWNTEDYYSELNYRPIQSVLSDNSGSIIYSLTTIYGEPVILIRDVYINADGSTIITTIYAAPEDIGSVYEDYWNGVTADGEFYPLTWTLEEIKALSDD